MEYLAGVVERITFNNEENGFSVIKIKSDSSSELITVVGNLAAVSVGSVLRVGGAWRVDSRFGRQFCAESYEETVPATVTGLEKYLGSGMIKGIGPAYAKRIVGHFREKTIKIIDNAPERLSEVEGIGPSRIGMIKEAWREQKEIKNVMIFLQGNGVSTAYAVKIFKTYGNKSIDIVKENPFRLADDIWGIGFRTADKIASKLGISKESSDRCRAGIIYTLNELSEDGHCYAERGQLIKKCIEILELDEGQIDLNITSLINEKMLISQADAVSGQLSSGADAASMQASSGAEAAVPGMAAASAAIAASGITASATGTLSTGAARAGAVTAGTAVDALPREAIYLPAFYYSEEGTARRIQEILKGRNRKVPELLIQQQMLDRIIVHVERESGISYDDVQKDAIRKAAGSKFIVLTGGPGTGKTTTTLAILKIFQKLGAECLLAAPTGRAAKRMSEACGKEAKTIHRLLEYKLPGGYKRDSANPLKCDVLIIDETSMVDIMLMYNLLKAVPDEAIVVLVGDVDQLPSVGAGNVLRDIISSGAVEVVKLSRIFRQASGSAIITNAHKINNGEMPWLKGTKGDFFFIEESEPPKVAETIVELCTRRLPVYYGADPINDIQVLCPMQRGETGAVNLNAMLQEALNRQLPSSPCVQYGGRAYRLKDKVMQIRNNYEKNVFNGDIGYIVKIDAEDRKLVINFDGNDTEYDTTELDEVVLAYATTVHKSQGSEFPIVVAPLTTQHFMMLQRNLLYTCVTRAKKAFVLVGTKKAVGISVSNNKIQQRNTMLAARLKAGTIKRQDRLTE